MHFTMHFSTGYTAVYTYTQTHLHDLLVANYTGNGQSTVEHLRSHIEQYGNNKLAVVAVHMKKK